MHRGLTISLNSYYPRTISKKLNAQPIFRSWRSSICPATGWNRSNLRFCTALKTLIIAYNRIQSLRGLQEMWGKQFSLQRLDARENRVDDLNELIFLGGLVNCTECLFVSKGRAGNTICDDPNYRAAVIQAMPGILFLDDEPCEKAPDENNANWANGARAKPPVLKAQRKEVQDAKQEEKRDIRIQSSGVEQLNVLRHELRIQSLEKRFGGWANSQLTDAERRHVETLQHERDAFARERSQCDEKLRETSQQLRTLQEEKQRKDAELAANFAKVDAEFSRREALRVQVEEKYHALQAEFDAERKAHDEAAAVLEKLQKEVAAATVDVTAHARLHAQQTEEQERARWQKEVEEVKCQLAEERALRSRDSTDWQEQKTQLDAAAQTLTQQLLAANAQLAAAKEECAQRVQLQFQTEESKTEALMQVHAEEAKAAQMRLDALRADFNAVHDALEQRNEEVQKERLFRCESEEQSKHLAKEIVRLGECLLAAAEKEKELQKKSDAEREQLQERWKVELAAVKVRHQEDHLALDTEVKRVIKDKHKDLEVTRSELETIKRRNQDMVHTIHRSTEQERMSKHVIDTLALRLERARLEAEEAVDSLKKQQTACSNAEAELERVRQACAQQTAAHQAAAHRAELERDAALRAQREAEGSVKTITEELQAKCRDSETHYREARDLAERRLAEVKDLQGVVDACTKNCEAERQNSARKADEITQAYELKLQIQNSVIADHPEHVQKLKADIRQAKEDAEQWKDTLERKERKWNETLAKDDQWHDKCIESEAAVEELRREIAFLKDDVMDKEEALKFASSEVEELKQLFDTTKKDCEKQYEDEKREAVEQAMEQANNAVESRIAQEQTAHLEELQRLHARCTELAAEKARADAKVAHAEGKVATTEKEMRVLLVETQRAKQKFQEKMGKMEEFVASLKSSDTGWL
eukprot:GEMP01008609.1.p1 GENE.GEMP01008609.1~~GEMP01008609.1.p1  ORF type:complete len:934 (+),score=360.72 GEMP01008609.1:191-2992(+)